MKMKKITIFFGIFVTVLLIYNCDHYMGGAGSINNGVPANGFLDSYFLSGSEEEQEIIKTYFSLLAAETARQNGSEAALAGHEKFVIIRDIAQIYMSQREYGRLITFLNRFIHEYPDDPFNTYYLFMIAFAYGQMDAYPMAALYFDRIVKNYPDLMIQGNSIHLASLNMLTSIVDDPIKRVWYYEELISRFLSNIDPGPAYFMLAQAYEAIGEWEMAIRSYTQYLPYTGSNVPGFPNADNHARHMVSFNNSARNWTFPSLEALVTAIKSAIDAGSSARLLQYHARVNFFTRTWEGEDDNNSRTFDLHLADFMRNHRIRYADELDINSNANEAYLRTWGWPNSASGWYFYFRKIHFPLDPDIHGNWEWAGIYYGERF